MLEELQKLAWSLGVKDRVRFLGYFSHDTLARIYRLSDVFLLPTLWEGHPRVVLEAMAANLPVIGSNYGAITDLVGPDDGLQVDPTNVEDMASAILDLATDEELRQAMARHPTFDPNDFSIESVSNLEASTYKKILAQR